jgi:hypothetical protein
MTESVFLAIHNQASVNTAVTFNINFDQAEGANTGTITGFTATYNAIYNGSTQSPPNPITDILLQIERAELEIAGQTIILNVINRSAHQGVGNNPYIYFEVEDVIFTVPNFTDAENSTIDLGTLPITFTPILSNTRFEYNDYNPLSSNAILNRSSNRIMSSDRNETTVNPQNIDSLLSTSASKAQVTDSLYYDTGWSNARYVGSETSANDFGGIEPAILGRTFRGEVYTTSTSNQIICTGSSAGRVIEELLHNGPQLLPDFELGNSTMVVGTAAISDLTQTSFLYSPTPTSLKKTTDIPVVVGSVITIENEKMRVEAILPDSILRVERGYLNTIPETHNSGLTISASAFTRIFNFEENNSKIAVVDNSNVYLEETRVVLGTDKYGVEYSKFECD